MAGGTGRGAASRVPAGARGRHAELDVSRRTPGASGSSTARGDRDPAASGASRIVSADPRSRSVRRDPGHEAEPAGRARSLACLLDRRRRLIALSSDDERARTSERRPRARPPREYLADSVAGAHRGPVAEPGEPGPRSSRTAGTSSTWTRRSVRGRPGEGPLRPRLLVHGRRGRGGRRGARDRGHERLLHRERQPRLRTLPLADEVEVMYVPEAPAASCSPATSTPGSSRSWGRPRPTTRRTCPGGSRSRAPDHADRAAVPSVAAVPEAPVHGRPRRCRSRGGGPRSSARRALAPPPPP